MYLNLYQIYIAENFRPSSLYYVLAMNWFNGDELDGSGAQGYWIRVESKLTFELVLYSYQPHEVEVGLGQQKILQVCSSFSSV
jgi:hypothetical protein